MKFSINRASNKSLKNYPNVTYNPDGGYHNEYIIDINDFSDLAKLEEDFNSQLIISLKHEHIEIYDGYIE